MVSKIITSANNLLKNHFFVLFFLLFYLLRLENSFDATVLPFFNLVNKTEYLYKKIFLFIYYFFVIKMCIYIL
jgi:hypothetical protein